MDLSRSATRGYWILPIPPSFTLVFFQARCEKAESMEIPISWQLLVGGHTTIKVYDILGKEVVTLADEYQSAGLYKINFDGNGLPSGVYFYELNTISSEGTKSFSAVKKLILLK